MELNQYLQETFEYNDFANKLVLEKISQLPEKDEAIKLFSHLINSMNKWMARIVQDPAVNELDWWKPEYPFEELSARWTGCLNRWLDFIRSKTEDELFAVIQYTGSDGGRWEVPLKDIPLQLNYHSIHHRAQIQSVIRRQGLVPDFVDYIGTKYRKLP
jgi:uncharacterized damage-inducible protein DinB